jgi:phospholipid-translocating ATPase
MSCRESRRTRQSTTSCTCKLTRRLTPLGFSEVKSEDIMPGDVLLLKKRQRVPADSVLLHASNSTGTVYVQTDQLDGETDWKVREAIRTTKNLVDDLNPPGARGGSMDQGRATELSSRNTFAKGKIVASSYFNFDKFNYSAIFSKYWQILVEAPCDSIYSFDGNFKDAENNTEPLRLSNTIWANMKISTGNVLVVVIYVGKETRMALNSRQQIDKFGKTDNQINFLFKTFFVVMIVATIIHFIISGHWVNEKPFIQFFRILVILMSVLPFMLKLNTDVAKLFYSYEITNDESIEGTIVRNRQIPEELGRIEYLLSDKTGTLTRNEMIFKNLITLTGNFNSERFPHLKALINSHFNQASDSDRNTSAPPNLNTSELPRHTQLDKSSIVASILNLILCNNVSPTTNNGERMLQASSPDEVALVNFAESLELLMMKRTTDTIEIQLPNNSLAIYKVLENFPFSSDRKRMGIILKNLQTHEITFYIKGADSVMEDIINQDHRIFIQENASLLSKKGLRTLVLGQKTISQKAYDDWKVRLTQAQINLKTRVAEEERLVNELEKNMEFLGITGVEDLLQEGVKAVISNIREAGIKVWMLTGDKLETAQCIAISTGFKNTTQQFYLVSETDPLGIEERLNRFYPFDLLLVTGNCLDVIFRSSELSDLFFAKACEAQSVVLCRCAPKQKSQIVLYLKERYQKTVCAVGDGGNDVGMIQCASVGIGIEGKEGKQASLASDFSIKKFKHLLKLFLWHGRNSFVRTSKLSCLVFHRSVIYGAIQYLFMVVFYFITLNIYNGYLTMFYSTVFTNFLVFVVIFDNDIPVHQAFNYPALYRLCQKGLDLSTKTIMLWLFIGIFQGATIIMLSVHTFERETIEMATITFTALIFIDNLNVLSLVRTWHWLMLFAFVFNITCYLICLIPLRKFFDLAPIDIYIFAKIIALIMVGWLPFHLAHFLQRRCFKNPIDKMISEARTQEKRRKLGSKFQATEF